MAHPNFVVTIKIVNNDSQKGSDPHVKDVTYTINCPVYAASEDEAIKKALEQCKKEQSEWFKYECMECITTVKATPGNKKITTEEINRTKIKTEHRRPTGSKADVAKSSGGSKND